MQILGVWAGGAGLYPLAPVLYIYNALGACLKTGSKNKQVETKLYVQMYISNTVLFLFCFALKISELSHVFIVNVNNASSTPRSFTHIFSI